jgi:purine-binding chemotaxis protein CheW
MKKKEEVKEQEYTIEDVKRASEKETIKEKGELLQLIVFKLNDGEYALQIDQIKEVVLTPRIAQVPQTPAYLKGVANIRGNVIAIIDLEQKFNLGASSTQDDSSANYTLVIESDEYKVGVLVKEVPNTLTVEASEIDSSASIIQFSSLNADCIEGIVKIDDRMIIQVNMLELMRTDELKNYSDQEFLS